MSFFGRKVSGPGSQNFQGDVASDLRKRHKGVRIKHRMKSNQVKMYDKSSVLRIETTINDPHDFKIYKDTITKGGYHKKMWVPMGKSIANMYRYAQVSATVIINNRRYSGFNILKEETIQLFEILSNGSFLIKGFTNQDIRKKLYASEEQMSAKVRNRTTRLIRKLIAHGLVWKTPKTMSYHITIKGRKVLGHILFWIKKEYPKDFAFVQ